MMGITAADDVGGNGDDGGCFVQLRKWEEWTSGILVSL